MSPRQFSFRQSLMPPCLSQVLKWFPDAPAAERYRGQSGLCPAASWRGLRPTIRLSCIRALLISVLTIRGRVSFLRFRALKFAWGLCPTHQRFAFALILVFSEGINRSFFRYFFHGSYLIFCEFLYQYPKRTFIFVATSL